MEERNYTVYRHIAPNGKMYVGITKQEPQKRWANGRGYINNIYFGRAIEKYGWQNIKHEVLLDCLTEKEARFAEEVFIFVWNLQDPKLGYNILSGGEINSGANHPNYGKRRSDETRRKISIANSGNRHYNYGGSLSDSHKHKISKALIGANNPYYGKKHSDEVRRKMSDASINKRKVIALDKNTMKIIAIYNSITQAEQDTGTDHSSISKCCRNKMITAGGYIWRYADEYITKDTERRGAI